MARKFTERLDIKMTKEDMYLLAQAAYNADKPLTVYARDLIVKQINPLFKGELPNENRHVEDS